MFEIQSRKVQQTTLEGRWAVFWTHINMKAGIVAAGITALIYSIGNGIKYHLAIPRHYYVWIGSLGLLAYIGFAVWNIILTYKIASKTEHEMLTTKYHQKSEAQQVELTKQPLRVHNVTT